MGIYLNSGNEFFKEAVNSEIYVDKTMLIDFTNHVIETTQKEICVSRPRRFGKSIALHNMRINCLCFFVYPRTCNIYINNIDFM